MLCQICHKNTATIHIQEIIDGESKTLQICAECAAGKSWSDSLLHGFNIAEMLYNFTSNLQLDQEQNEENSEQGDYVLKCGKCNWDLQRFREKGRLGCENCYAVFQDLLFDALKNMHKSTTHQGKTPDENSDQLKLTRKMAKVAELQQYLDDLVRDENYEKAALIRDKIAALKTEIAQAPE